MRAWMELWASVAIQWVAGLVRFLLASRQEKRHRRKADRCRSPIARGCTNRCQHHRSCDMPRKCFCKDEAGCVTKVTNESKAEGKPLVRCFAD
jgi:hypothetical protein